VPNLFQTLSQKTEQPTPTQGASFIPFGEKATSDKQEPSSLRIIPNVADFDKDLNQAPSTPSERKDIIICSYCGAMLSSDYAFCNKCGAKLQ
jgi:ribosomal protein L40E